MKKYKITEPLPSNIKKPLSYRERGRPFDDGTFNHPLEVVNFFEAMDVLGGNMELVDRQGTVIRIYSDDPQVIRRNTYPKDNEGIYYTLE